MKILITGGAGFIGSHTVDLLVEKGHKVIIIDNLSTGFKENINPKTIFYNEDLDNHEKIGMIFKKEKPEVVYHLAAQINVRESVANPIKDAQENILNTLNILELSVKNNTKHFIFASSGGVIYGDTKITPTTEKHLENPVSPYGCSKLAMEKYLIYYNKIHDLKFTSLRYSNVYGPRQNSQGESGVVAIFFNQMFSNQNPQIFGGLQTRDFVYVKDVARANLLALNDNKSKIYNVGTGKETDIIEISSKINRFFKNKFQAEYKEKKKGEQERSCLSYKKIKNSLGWEPLTKLNEGLERVYMWHLKKIGKI